MPSKPPIIKLYGEEVKQEEWIGMTVRVRGSHSSVHAKVIHRKVINEGRELECWVNLDRKLPHPRNRKHWLNQWPTKMLELVYTHDWRDVLPEEYGMTKALPKNDETVEHWNGEAWDLVPTLHLDPSQRYRTKRPLPNNAS